MGSKKVTLKQRVTAARPNSGERILNLENLIDQDTGLVRAADGGRDNMPVTTAIAIILTESEAQAVQLTSRFVMFLTRTSVSLGGGIFRRYPGANDNSVDNMVAACCISRDYAKIVYACSNTTKWCYNVASPGTFSFQYWYQRFIGFPSFVKASSEALNPIDALSIQQPVSITSSDREQTRAIKFCNTS